MAYLMGKNENNRVGSLEGMNESLFFCSWTKNQGVVTFVVLGALGGR